MQIDYNKFWEDNIASHAHHPSVRLRNAFIMNSLEDISFDSLIDVGCWDAELIKLIRWWFSEKKYAWIDISENIIAKDRLALPEVEFSLWNIWIQQFETSESYDVVICSEVIEHILDWKAVVQNIAKLTQSGGYAILTTQSGKRYKSDLNIGHLKHFDLEELESEFEKAGFIKKVSYKKWWPFYNLQKWLYEKIEWKAQAIQHGELTILSKMIFQVAYTLFTLTPISRHLWPQIFMIFQKQ